jgi:xanthine dehydrogenase large subunit
VVATSTEAARKAARLARVDYEELPAILDVRTALEQRSFILPTRTLNAAILTRACARRRTA